LPAAAPFGGRLFGLDQQPAAAGPFEGALSPAEIPTQTLRGFSLLLT
jgi:hypothetical protein